MTTDEENEKLYREASPGVRAIVDRLVQRLVRARLSPRHNSPQKVEILADERARGWLRPRTPNTDPERPRAGREME